MIVVVLVGYKPKTESIKMKVVVGKVGGLMREYTFSLR